ncbi:diguanylate cyclase [Pacificimonas sp. WHA3]|uniref:diguanylate cyclase n=1 Tax=Pacificimonas pallii TaxID=2827236 RepID=A0ABS6SB28_9SPHN|nr:diguanylate cyclase [Pacificimonas pallii]MBV7255622.1 diguanylate cyclase [Pacificimonas pallii]
MFVTRLLRSYAAIGPIALCAGYCVVASLSLELTRGSAGIAAMWPASGLVIAALTMTRKSARLHYLAAAGVGSLVINALGGMTATNTIAFTVANVVEPWVAILLIERMGSQKIRFDMLPDVGRFFLAAAGASATGAVLSTALSQSDAAFMASWFVTVVLGIMIVTPICVSIADLLKTGWNGDPGYPSVIEAGIWLLIITAVTSGVFFQSSYPLLFVPSAIVVAATYRLGNLGAGMGVLIVAIVGTVSTGLSYGPTSFASTDLEVAIAFLQFYLVVQLVTVLPLSAALTARQHLAEQLGESVRLLKQAESAAGVGHWRIDLGTDMMFWSDQVYSIHGLEIQPFSAGDDGLAVYRTADRANIRHIIQEASKTGEDFEYRASIKRPDGQVRHIMSKGSVEVGDDGQATALFGMLQDITWHVESAKAVQEARQAAEAAAQSAVLLANTDELTGLPNRRRTMEALNEAIQTAEAMSEDLSVAIFDIDHFKRINDRFGHAEGDKIIRAVARSADAAGRADDFVGRIGGEEFAMLLPSADEHFGLAAAERVRARVETETKEVSAHSGVTVSIGVATYTAGMSPEELLDMADKALYAAKESGRNVVRLFTRLQQDDDASGDSPKDRIDRSGANDRRKAAKGRR